MLGNILCLYQNGKEASPLGAMETKAK